MKKFTFYNRNTIAFILFSDHFMIAGSLFCDKKLNTYIYFEMIAIVHVYATVRKCTKELWKLE